MTLHLDAARIAVPDAMAGLDPALPDLARSFDLPAIGRLFARHWQTTITRCTLLGARYEPDVRCVTTYELKATNRDGSPARTIGVVEVTPAGRSHRRFDDDRELPGLAAASDAKVMAERLAGCCPATIESCTVTVVRYRPGERAVLRYVLMTASGQLVLYGKVLPNAASLAATLTALHESAQADPAAPTVPAPITLLDDLDLVIQPAANGESLHGRAFALSCGAAERAARFRRTGRAVAALHDGSRPEVACRLPRDEADELRTYLPAVRSAAPELADRLADAIDTAARNGADRSAAELVASHGSLRTDQVHTSTGRVTLLDLDGYCSSHRSRDIGNLLAYLRWKAIRQPQYRVHVAEGRRAFQAGYARSGHAPAEDAVRRAEAMSLLKIAGRRFRNLSVHEWPRVPTLIDAAFELCGGASG